MEREKETYNVLIIEQDSPERGAITSVLSCSDMPLTISCTDSVAEAEEIVKTKVVDIVIFRAEWSEEDGLSAIERLRGYGCEARFVIISDRDDYALVRRALTLHASDYIVRPIDPSDLISSLGRILDEIGSGDRGKRRLESLLLENRSFKVNRVLGELVSSDSGNLSESAEEFAALTFSGKYVTLVLLETTEPIALKREERILQLILQYSRELAFCLNMSDSRELLFFVSERLPNKKMLKELGEYIRHKINVTFATDCFVMIGMPAPNGKKLSKVFDRIDSLTEYRFFMRQGAVLLDREKYFTGTNINEALEGLLNCIYEDIRYGEYSKAIENIRLLVKTIEAESGLSNIYVRHIFIEILGKMASSSHELTSEENMELVKYVLSASDIFAIEEKIIGTIERLEGRKDEQEKKLVGSDKAVDEVVRIIRAEYTKTNLSVEYLASRVFLSPNYLSVLFRDSVGVSINSFLMDYRLDKAKKLLTSSNIKINEIAGMVGYSSSSYFVTVFKKHCGITPAKFREDNSGPSKK